MRTAPSRCRAPAPAALLVLLCALAVCADVGPQQPEERVLPLPAVGECYRISGRVGKVGGSVRVLFGDGKVGMMLNIRGADMPSCNHHWQLTPLPKDTAIGDGALEMELSGLGTKQPRYRKTYFVRPDIRFYIGDRFKKALDQWKSFPPASQHVFLLEARHRGSGVELWMDGRYFTRFGLQKGWDEVVVKPSEGAQILRVVTSKDPESDLFLPLDIGRTPHQGRTTLADLSLEAAAPAMRKVTVAPVALDKQVDVGLSEWLRRELDSASFYDPYYRRSAWDSVPETIIFQVPRRFYRTAHVLCAVDPQQSPTMGVRIGRYRQAWDGSGMSQADTNVRLDPAAPEGVREMARVGTVKVRENGQDRLAPVYLASIPLRTGEVADYLQWQGNYDGRGDWGERLDHLMIEFTRQMHTRVTVNCGIFDKKPLGARSGVHILGVVLEKALVEIRVTSDEPGFSFYKEARPALAIETSSAAPQPQQLRMQVRLRDFDGKETLVERTLKVPQGKKTERLGLEDLELGWYSAEFTFADAQGNPVWEQTVSFALLPPDTRKAGNESPFGTWWFKGSHYTEPHADKALPIMQKMGFRHVTPPRVGDKRNKERGMTQENFARYTVTPSMCGRIKGDKPQEQVTRFFQEWPGTQFAMIFHETRLAGMGIGLPPELTGGAPFKLPETATERVAELRRHIETHAAAIRKAAPKARIMLGNGGTNFNVFWLRQKLPRDLWDCVGMEMAVQTFHPEGQPTGWNLQSLWIAKRMKEIYGYEDLPTASCYEFDYRATAPGGLALERQADWYARDVLHCLAYRLPSINVALLMDCNSAYYTSRWGSTGVCFRSPLHMPKPSFVSLATLTLVLDRARYVRYLDTGSTGVYCLEFAREDERIYAIWAGRGRRPMTLSLDKADAAAKVIDSMGRQTALREQGGKLSLAATESPCYLVTQSKITGVTLGEPEHENVKLEDAAVLDAMDDPARWRIAADPDEAFADYCAYKPMVKGEVTIAAGEEGSLRLAIAKQPDVAGIIGRYAVLEPAGGPIPVEGRPNAVGVWVKGNANWGRVYFEFEDAKGRRWTSNGWQEAPNSWDMSDWEADTALNHDGWRLVCADLPAHYACGYYNPSFRDWRCQQDSNKGNAMAYPLKFARLYVVMREKVVYLTDMVPAKGLSIELKGLTVGTSPQESD